MSSDENRLSVSSVRRFPVEVREELNRFLRRSSWQCLTREFSIDVLTGLKAEALDDIADLVDSVYPEFQDDVRKRVTILKSTEQGKNQSFKGKSKVGFHSYFYRYLPLSCLSCMQSIMLSHSQGDQTATALAHGLFCKWPITCTNQTRPRSIALALFGEMILSLKLYESSLPRGPKAFREVGGPSRTGMTNRFPKLFVSVRTFLLCSTVFFFALPSSVHATFSKNFVLLSICERCRVSLYKWTALELESLLRWRTYEPVKIKKLSHTLE